MDDKRLERLYDYTKFHIGIYLSAAGGLAALISTAAKDVERAYIASLIGAPWAIVMSFIFMVLAGIAGAVVATSTIESESYDSFLTSSQGAFGIKRLSGKTWVTIEHACFWLSLIFLVIGVLYAETVLNWILARKAVMTCIL